MQPGHDGTVHVVPFDHGGQRVAEPVFELGHRIKHVWHEKMQQRPQLHHGILQWRAGQQQPPLRVEMQQRVPPL